MDMMNVHNNKSNLAFAFCVFNIYFMIFCPAAANAAPLVNQIPQPPAGAIPHYAPYVFFIYFNWVLNLVSFSLLIWESWRTRSLFPYAFVVGAMLGSLVETVFDANIHPWFIYPPGFQASWHIYNIPYPWYEFAGNMTLAGPLYLMYYMFRRGVSARGLWLLFVCAWAFDALQEVPGTATGAYLYLGKQPFVLGGWPVWVGMLAPLGYALVGYLGYVMQGVLSGARLWWAQVILQPVVLYGCEVISWPMWDTLNGGANILQTHLAAILSLIFTLVAYSVMIAVYLKGRDSQVE
jgi:hypothetical protein